jgi:HEAT repeat protein
MLTLPVTIALLFGSSLVLNSQLQAQQPQQAHALLQQLQSAQTSDEAAEKLLKLGSSDSKAREYLAVHLPAIIEKEPLDPARPWTNAVRLAGDLKIAEAAPALAKWIGLNNGGTITLAQEARLETNAPGGALAQIGAAAIPSLIGVLNHGNLHERWNAAFALNLIGSTQAKAALRDHLNREPDSTLREFVEGALK